MSHTKGPWEWEYGPYSLLRQTATRKHILYYTMDDDGIYCTNLDDYDLIAAAPDLYAALVMFLEEDTGPDHPAKEVAKKALAKARGESA